MQSTITLVFPHQLFKQAAALHKEWPVYLVEEWLFFRQYNFHKQKLMLHRASMQYYRQWLQQQGYTVHYIETFQKEADCRELIRSLQQQGITAVHITDPVDDWLLCRIKKACTRSNTSLQVHHSANFLNKADDPGLFRQKGKTFFQTDFYIRQRKKRNILLEKDGKPLGAKWSFDADNRKKYPRGVTPPAINLSPENKFINEAKQYISLHFPGNIGELNTPPLFVITHCDAEDWLNDFLQHRFEKFGEYEDAIVANEQVLHHSVLTPMLNTCLLNPQQVIDKALEVASQKNIPLNSLEGFIRQVMGWREFIRLVYEKAGRRQRTTNYWGFTRKIPPCFWNGSTGIDPIDSTIKKIIRTGYCHHIERLMVLGNFMLLCEFDPDDVYRWFMELFIDAYDWVMVPNVYGMTQFADGGLMTTKPYISGSNYLMKMSDYPKGPWQQVWDGLFWRFMHRQRHFFLQNPRLGMLIKTLDKMPAATFNAHLQQADNFLQQLDKQLKNEKQEEGKSAGKDLQHL